MTDRPLTIADAIRAAARAGRGVTLALAGGPDLLGEHGTVLGRGKVPGTDEMFTNVRFSDVQARRMLDRLDASPPDR